MFLRLRLSFYLAKQAIATLKQKKSLLILPFVSGFFSLVTFALIMAPASDIFIFVIDKSNEQSVTHTQWAILIGSFIVFLFIATFITLFFNAALTACTLQLMKEKDCQISSGIKTALKRIHVIFLWSLVMTTFGLIIQVIQNLSRRWRILEIIIASVLSITWSIATFFVIPTLVVENKSPIDAFKRSMQLMRETWGESLISSGGIAIIMFGFFMVSLLPLAIGLHLKGSVHIVPGLITTTVLFIIVMLISTTLQTILRSGLYLYATHDPNVGAFDPNLLKFMFKSKKQNI